VSAPPPGALPSPPRDRGSPSSSPPTRVAPQPPILSIGTASLNETAAPASGLQRLRRSGSTLGRWLRSTRLALWPRQATTSVRRSAPGCRRRRQTESEQDDLWPSWPTNEPPLRRRNRLVPSWFWWIRSSQGVFVANHSPWPSLRTGAAHLPRLPQSPSPRASWCLLPSSRPRPPSASRRPKPRRSRARSRRGGERGFRERWLR
jgi:hypothetical protein